MFSLHTRPGFLHRKHRTRGGECIDMLTESITERLPGGLIAADLLPHAWEFRYGLRITAARFLHSLAVYCVGCRLAGTNRAVAWLRPPYPVLYHFTPESNAASILSKGLLPNRGAVYLTDWTDQRWCARLKNPASTEALVCFRVDTEGLIGSGHKVAAMNAYHEFTTDYVPPDCLTLTEVRI